MDLLNVCSSLNIIRYQQTKQDEMEAAYIDRAWRMGNANRLEGTVHLEDPVGNGNSLCIYYVHTCFLPRYQNPRLCRVMH